MKIPQGLKLTYFHGRIYRDSHQHLCAEALRRGVSKARAMSEILIEHKMSQHLPFVPHQVKVSLS